MKGWIIIGLLAGAVYYFATETDKLDEPIAQTEAVIKKISRKLDSMTGTTIIKVDNTLRDLKAQLAERLNSQEVQELETVLTDTESAEDFRDQFCDAPDNKHIVFSKENLRAICDAL